MSAIEWIVVLHMRREADLMLMEADDGRLCWTTSRIEAKHFVNNVQATIAVEAYKATLGPDGLKLFADSDVRIEPVTEATK